MISQLEKEITLRFLKARKKDSFLNIISIFSFIGISLGVAVLIIVMSVMNGFRSELINKIIGFNAHITVKPYENRLKLDDPKNNNLFQISKNLIFSNSGESIIIKNNISKGILLRGYLNEDFSKLDTEDLIVAVKAIVDTAPIQTIKAQIDEAKKIFYDRSNEAYKIALDKFKSEQEQTEENTEEENQIEFEYNYPHTKDFKSVLAVFRSALTSFSRYDSYSLICFVSPVILTLF